MQQTTAAALPPAKAKFTKEEAKAALRGMGATLLFEKVLTTSDVNGSGRLVIPKNQAENHFPHLDQPTGTMLKLTDTDSNQHSFRFRFWINNQSRMYLLEHTNAVLTQFNMVAGDVLVFAKMPDGNFAVCGRQGTKGDVSRRPAARRTSGNVSEGGKRGRALESAKSRRLRQKQSAQAVAGMFGYWAATSLPMKKDGVFRAVPHFNGSQEGDKVVAQCGAWSAIVKVDGELFQAFFDTLEAASAALDAALQVSAAEQLAEEAEMNAALAARVAAVSAPSSAAPGGATTAGGTTTAGGSEPLSRGTSVEPSIGTGPSVAATSGHADVEMQEQQQQQQQQQPPAQAGVKEEEVQRSPAEATAAIPMTS
ncbi:hypothetical protein D9Q98_004490 [Chlorella vulgaris]|uniref:TF-B3 domain-containing protein n=1 Tax=Chlorella vulgaris TaxID=3077 RepID=A0A9D4TPZ3_CHLVU|nr:hypothetical protein D9Q98_004490 [Chlorella vulgaris]